jgi:hypothetical protein
MSIQRFEGFDHFTADADLAAKGMIPGSTSTFTYLGGQYAGSAIVGNAATDVLVVPYVTAVTESFVGFWLYLAAAPGAVATILEFHSSDTPLANPHLSLKVNTNLSLEVFRDGSTSILASSASAIAVTAWTFVEMRALVNNVTGAYEVKLNESSLISGSSINTASGTGTDYAVDSIRLIGAATMEPRFDDLVIVDTTVAGSEPITYTGKVTVATLWPSADGALSQFTGVGTGAANYDRVDETPGKDDDTSYVQSSTVGNRDLYDFDNIPGGYAGLSTILAVQTSAAVRKAQPGTKELRTNIRSVATDVNGSNVELTAGYKYTPAQIEATDPNTASAWTTSGVNAMQAGIEIMT